MGKQIYFIHTEDDIIQFADQIEKASGKFLVNGVLFSPSEFSKQLVSSMSMRSCQYSIVYAPDKTFEKQCRSKCIYDGTAMEFSNSGRSVLVSSAYEIGRLYLARNQFGDYDTHLLALYSKLRTYIRKNYFFNKHPDIYLSQIFKDQYEKGSLCAAQCGVDRPLLLERK